MVSGMLITLTGTAPGSLLGSTMIGKYCIYTLRTGEGETTIHSNIALDN